MSTGAQYGAQAIPLPIAEQAMHWQLELQELAASEHSHQRLHEESLAWRQEHPLHELAWQRAEALTTRMRQLREPGRAGLASTLLERPLNRRAALKQLALLLAAGGLAWSQRDSALVQRWTSDYSSGVGEQRTLQLDGQVRIGLNTDSAIDLRFDTQQRVVQLLRGELLLQVPQVDPRPIWIRTVEGRVQPLGRSVAVRQLPGSTQVVAVDGAVSLQPQHQRDGWSRLQPGEMARFDATATGPVRAQQGGELAWRHGMLVAHGQPLAAFLAELGRYRPGHLGCDAVLNGLRVSGTFPLADTDRVIDVVSHTLDLDVRRLTPYWVTLKPRSRTS